MKDIEKLILQENWDELDNPNSLAKTCCEIKKELLNNLDESFSFITGNTFLSNLFRVTKFYLMAQHKDLNEEEKEICNYYVTEPFYSYLPVFKYTFWDVVKNVENFDNSIIFPEMFAAVILYDSSEKEKNTLEKFLSSI